MSYSETRSVVYFLKKGSDPVLGKDEPMPFFFYDLLSLK